MNERKDRPDPDAILREIRRQEVGKKGRLKLFFAYAAGAGKTYAMLDEARGLYEQGKDILVGYLEPHMRPETLELLEGLPILPPKSIVYRNIEMKEFDLDEALKRKPELILVDELAHTNGAGSRNKKRYQDVEELLRAGIDVYTTINVQHIESLNDIVAGVTGIGVQETVPDYIFDRADKVKLVDIEPEELLKRFSEGRVYQPMQAEIAVKNFFTRENLGLLREIAIRKVADKVSSINQSDRGGLEKIVNPKFLVCFGSAPSSAKCIRWAARAAEAFHVSLKAVYVESAANENLEETEEKLLKRNVDLAEKMGAEVVILTGDSPSKAIADYAKMSGITNIVIGKSKNARTWRNFFAKDMEDQLVALLPNIEIHIISDGNNQRFLRKTKKIEFSGGFSWSDTGKMFFLLFLATLLSWALEQLSIGEQNTIMVYILSVLIISRVTKGYIYGLISSVLSVLTFNFFFTEPYFTFNAISAGYPVTFVIMFLVALITSTLTVRVKTQAQVAVAREQRTDALYEINKRLLGTRGVANIVDLSNSYIVSLFGRSVIFYSSDPIGGAKGIFLQGAEEENSSFMKSASEQAVAHWVFINEKNAGSGTDTLMGASCFYMPIISEGVILGVVGISCIRSKLEPDERFFLQMVISLVATALERQRLSDSQRGLLVESEKEKMRGNLLRAIAHDLRAPLTNILEASSGILKKEDIPDKKTHEKLAAQIKEDSQWLMGLVDNLLSVTRIREGKLSMVKTIEPVEKVISEGVNRLHKIFPDRQISVRVPSDLLLVPMDSTLIIQVLINLLENAVKNSPAQSLIEVEAYRKGKFAHFEVMDHGCGIPAERIPFLFDQSSQSEKKETVDDQAETGIGLSICMSIIKAHGGEISAKNRPDGGAIFEFSLPLGRGRSDKD